MATNTLKVLRGLSVVFPVVISTMASIMASGVTYNMLVQKSCSPGGPPEDINKFICKDVSLIDHINGILSTKAAVQAVISAVCGSFFGFLRDLTGKSKLLMYVGVFGEMIAVGGSFASAFYWNSSPWILVLIQAFASGGFGDNIMQIGATCILMTESSPEELPLRMQLYVIATLTTALLGGLVTTLVVTTLGYLWLFVMCLCLHAVALLLVVISVKTKGYDRRSLKESLEVLKKVFQRRENTTVLWLMLIALATGPIIFICEAVHISSFLQLKFHYTLYQNQVFGIYSFLIAVVGSMVGPLVLRNVFHLTELSIGTIACLFNSGACFMFAFVNTEVFLYICGAAYFMKFASLPLPNTVISTIVDNSELGTYIGINAILTSCLPVGITRLYREVSTRTIGSWVGAFYFVSSGCFLFLAALFSVSYCLYTEPKKKEDTKSEEEVGADEEIGKTSLPEDTTET